MSKPNRQTLLLAVVIVVGLVLVVYFAWFHSNGEAGSQRGRGDLALEDIPFDGRQSYAYLKEICELGPRPSGSDAMAKQQKMLSDHFRKLGGKVTLQEFPERHPQDGSRVTLANLIVEWHPDRRERILLCAHYDTRPYPDRDPRNRRGTFLGANDGASGVALLMELGRHMPDLEGPYGVDFVLFDGEEFVFDRDRDPYFLGSEHFAREYVANPPDHKYRAGVLLDMVGDAELQIYQERYSLRKARSLTLDIWNTARDLGVKEFIARSRHELQDDHLALNDIAKIPTCDVIDFDYPRPGAAQSFWHTEADAPDKCSDLSLAKVGWVMLEWLKRQQRSE